jgi:hypothetical protein
MIAAGALRHLRRTQEALATLDRLAAIQPNFSQMLQERGLPSPCAMLPKRSPP